MAKTVRVKSSAQNMIARSITMLPILYHPLRQRSRSHFQAQQEDRHHVSHRYDIQMTHSYWCLQHFLKLTLYKKVLPFTRRAWFWYRASSSYMAKDWMSKIGCAECGSSKEHNTASHSGPALWTKEADPLVQALWGGKHWNCWRCNIQMRSSHWFLLHFLHRKPASLLPTSGIEPNIKYRWRKQYLSSLQTQGKLTSKIPLSGLKASHLWRQYSWKKQMVPWTWSQVVPGGDGKTKAPSYS